MCVLLPLCRVPWGTSWRRDGFGRIRGKVRAVEEWPRPTDRTQLRRFLGFANFYRRFIRGVQSGVAAPLSALTSTVVPYLWSPEAEEAFTVRDHQQPRLLEPTSALGRVLPKHHGELGHRAIPFPVFPRLSATPFSLSGDGGRGTLGPGPALPLSARLEDGPEVHGGQLPPVPTRRQTAESPRP